MKKFSNAFQPIASGAAMVLVSVLSLLVLSGCPQKPEIMLGISLVADGLTHPVGMAVPDDGSGRKFIVDQAGKISVIDAAENLLPQPFLDVTNSMVALNSGYDERGLLSMALHPDFKNNGRFFIFYNVPLQPGDPANYDSRVRVAEFRVSNADMNAADPASEVILLEVLKPYSNHNGGQLAFGPDEFLYIGFGDGGNANDVGIGHTPGLGNGQDLKQLLGKILRYDVSTPGQVKIPAGNPFANDPDAEGAIYAYGFRNPWRFSFDAGGAHRLFCADVGQDLFEEVDIVTAGGNYGWNIKEGTHCFDPANPGTSPAQCADTGARGEPLVDPIIDYSHSGSQGSISGSAIVGGFIYRGSAIPALAEKYIFGDWSSSFVIPNGRIFVAAEKLNGAWQVSTAGVTGNMSTTLSRYLLGFGQDLSGEVYVLTSRNSGPSGATGEVFKLVQAQ